VDRERLNLRVPRYEVGDLGLALVTRRRDRRTDVAEVFDESPEHPDLVSQMLPRELTESPFGRWLSLARRLARRSHFVLSRVCSAA
jgi:hypothetical protein